jgi:Glycosyl hydrolase family 12
MGGTRRGTIGVVVLSAALAAGGLTTVRFLDAGQGAGSTGMGTPTAVGQAGTDSFGVAVAGSVQLAAAPHVAVMPAHGTGSAGKPAPSASRLGSAGPGPSAGSAAPTAHQSVASQPAPPAPSGSATCTNPQYVTSDPTAMWNLSPYFVANNMWNISGYNVSQTLHACSYSDWYVVATMDNSKGDGAVKTYPNSHRDFDGSPQISSFNSITSTFAETSPDSGIYEDAYDIWLNGIGTSASTEVMIWTSNHGQTPSGSVQATVTIGGQSYTVWKTTGNYIAFVASASVTSGTMNLLAFFQWLMSKGWITSTATLGQVDYGAELVSTNGVPGTFTFSGFSVNAT